MRICPASSDGRHYYTVIRGFMTCVHCYASQVVCDNHGPNWVKVEKR